MSRKDYDMISRRDHDRCCSDVIKEADEFVVYVFEQDDATDYQRMVFDDPETASRFKQGSNTLTSIQREIVNDLTNPASFLDKMVEAEQSNTKNLNKLSDEAANAELVKSQVVADVVFGMTPEEFEEKFKKLKKKFKKRRTEFEDKAKTALMEAAKIYLGEKHTAAYEKYKLELNKSGLSTILYQVHTMHQALDALSARMQASSSMISPKDVEAFVGLQRVMLDVQKFQFEYMQSVESSMKELRTDLEIAEHGQPTQSNDEQGIFFFKGGKEFLKRLSEVKNTMDDFIPTESKNRLLNPNAKTVIDVPHESVSEVSEKSELRNPFSGYEGQQKRQKRRNDGGEGLDEDEDDMDI